MGFVNDEVPISVREEFALELYDVFEGCCIAVHAVDCFEGDEDVPSSRSDLAVRSDAVIQDGPQCRDIVVRKIDPFRGS